MSGRIVVRLFGETALVRPDGASVRSVLAQPKRFALLVYLLLANRGGFVRRDRLLALFWPEKNESRARNSLRQSLHFLRRSLGPDAITTRGDGEVGVCKELFFVDVLDFEEHLAVGRVGEALAAHAGPFLDGFHLGGGQEFDAWIEEQRRRIDTLAWEAALSEARRLVEAGAVDEGARHARTATRLRPADEAAALLHMRCLVETGDRAGAEAERLRIQEAVGELGGAGLSLDARSYMDQLFDTKQERAPRDRWPKRVRGSAGSPGSGGVAREWAVPSTARVRWAFAGTVLLVAVLYLPGAFGLAGEGGEAAEVLSTLPTAFLLVGGGAPGSDADVEEALVSVLRIDLGRAPGFAILPGDHADRTLRMMRVDPATDPSEDQALEIARREGLAGIVKASARSVGEGFVLSAVVSARDGGTLRSRRVAAANQSELIEAFGRLSDELRVDLAAAAARTGSARPLPAVTTASEEALRLYQLAQEGGAAGHLERAVELDPSFAMAWLELGSRQRSDLALAAEYIGRALALRDGVTPAERYRIDFGWHEVVTGDPDAAAAASEAYRAARPRDEAVWLRQQILVAFRRRAWDEAVGLSLRKARTPEGLTTADWFNLVTLRFLEGNQRAVDSLLTDAPDEGEALRARFRIAFQRQEWDEAMGRLPRNIEALPREWQNGPYWRAMVHLGAGRIDQARAELDRSDELARSVGTPGRTVMPAAWAALAELHLLGDTAAARARLQAAEPHFGLGPPGTQAAYIWALAEVGDVDGAKAFMQRWIKSAPDPHRNRPPREWWAAEAAILIGDGLAEQAVALLSHAVREPSGVPFDCHFCPELMLARALDHLGLEGQAIPYFRMVADSRWILGRDREKDVVFLVPVRERLARFYEDEERYGEAAAEYREILRQWRDAGPLLGDRIEQAGEGLRRVTNAGGRVEGG